MTEVDPVREGSGPRGRSLRVLGVAVSIISVAAVVWWATKQDAPRLPHGDGQWAFLVLSLALYLVTACLWRGERWLLLLHENGAHEARRIDAYALSAVGFMGNNVLPARAGDAMRVVGMTPRVEVPFSTVIGTLIAERVLDVVVLLVIFLAVGIGLLHGVALPDGKRFVLVAVILAVVAVIAAVGGVLLWRRGTLRHWLEFLKPMAAATGNLHGRHGLEALGLTLAVWGTEIVVWWASAHAAGLDISILEGCYLISLSSIFVLVPAGPGYAGTLDAALVFGVKAIGGTGGEAISYLLLLRFVLLVPITIVGVIALITRYGGLRFLRTARAEEEQPEPV